MKIDNTQNKEIKKEVEDLLVLIHLIPTLLNQICHNPLILNLQLSLALKADLRDQLVKYVGK